MSACVLVIWAGPALAQSVSSATLQGTIKDESGGVLPGVTATLSGPSLQVGSLTQVTDTNGNYRFSDIPNGTYSLKFELSGFTTLIRDDLRLTVGFVARVDESLKVGVMSESVTVSGQSPVVDVTSTSASVAFTKEILDSVPRGRDLQNVLAMAPGVTQETMDVGGSTLAQRQDTASYGMAAQPKLQYEGMNIAMGADQNTPIYFIDNSLEEVQVRTSGNDAEVSTPGVSMVAIMKSGGNQFHGAYRGSYQPGSLQPEQPQRRTESAEHRLTSEAQVVLRLRRGSGRKDYPGQVVVLRRVRESIQERRNARLRGEPWSRW